MKVIIIGGGWSGCAAAITARKAGAEVELYEKTDMLVGLGNVGGIMRNNGRYTAAEELINLGAGDLINITDRNATHKNITFPGHGHARFIVLQQFGKLRKLGIYFFLEPQ
ncbi:MAG: FAD-dependent oxidoreductase [Clostridium lundense]|nr:FAD-dependent oxidoreductase [Clostridium lundense]